MTTAEPQAGPRMPLVFVVLRAPAACFADPAGDDSKRSSSPAMVKSVLLTLISLASSKRPEIWPTVTWLASMTGFTDRSVRQVLRQLEQMGAISNCQRTGRASVYTLNRDTIEAICNPGHK